MGFTMMMGFITAFTIGPHRATVVAPQRWRPPLAFEAEAEPEKKSIAARTGKVVVTAPEKELYVSRDIFQQLHDFGGNYGTIVQHGPSVAAAKKLLLSRNARYSGLLDVLQFSEGPLAEAMAGADSWLAVNVDVASLPEQLAAAKAAGVKRAFFLSYAPKGASAAPEGPDEAALASAGLEYSVMRTGPLVDARGAAVGLKLDEAGAAAGAAVGRDDVFRFAVEALTLPSAANRAWSLLPGDTNAALKEMRQSGCSRRDEVEALLSGKVVEAQKPVELTDAELAAKDKADAITDAEQKEAQEEEYKRLFAEARKLGEETAARKKYEDEEDTLRREAIMAQGRNEGGGAELFGSGEGYDEEGKEKGGDRAPVDDATDDDTDTPDAAPEEKKPDDSEPPLQAA